MRKRWRLLWLEYEPLWVLVAVSAAVAVAGFKLRYEPCVASLPAICAGPALFLLAACLVVFASRGNRVALVALILLAAADQGFYGLNRSIYSSNGDLQEWAFDADSPQAPPDQRVVSSLLPWNAPGVREGNRLTLTGWRTADGYAGLEPLRQLDYSNPNALRLAGVRWVRRDRTTNHIAELSPFGEQWLEVPAPLPRARLVTRTAPSFDPRDDLKRIAPEMTALTNATLSLPDSMPGKAVIVAERSGRLDIDIECPKEQLLVVGESFHSGWQATVEGRPSNLYRVNGDFMGCVVGPGREHVTLSFQPQSLDCGWLATCLGLALLAVYLSRYLISRWWTKAKDICNPAAAI